MKSTFYIISLILFLILNTESNAQTTPLLFPENHLDLKNPIRYEVLKQFGEQAQQVNFIDFTIEGKTIQDRSLFLFHIYRGTQPSKWKVFFFAQQHGNEPAGKDALIYLIHQIIKKPQLLPEDVELWLMPMVNPDGAENNQRRNGNDFDLNRDHQLLSQPETQTLHRMFRKIMPNISVDCHEFSRDSKEYDEKGWLEWPLIMMGCANNPLFSSGIFEKGIRWCEDAKPYMRQKGHNYTRYYLGGIPPQDELRYSAPDVDDARNGLGAYGGLSFIIESGVKYNAEDPNADLRKRVDAYLILFKQFLYKNKYRESDLEAIKQSRTAKLPDFIPTNYLWANNGPKTTQIKVIEKSTGKVIKIPTANFMQDLVIKNSVPSPKGYAISKEHVEIFKTLLDRHAISYKVMIEKKFFKAERCKLIKYEDFRDRLYNRYAGRQIVRSDTVLEKEFEIGSIYIELNNINGKRAALLLEPLQLYGLYQYQDFRNIIDEDKVLPVWRVLGNNR
ncbi:M14 family zinc carboxypeptidase [Calditrichota bacterium]